MAYPAPNYTQVPNILLDEHIQQMSDAELRVTLAIVRKTIGWQKRRDKISLTQLEELTGMSRQGVINGVEAGLSRGTISRIPDGNGYIYELTVSSEKVVNDVDQGKKNSQPSGPRHSQPSGPRHSQPSGHTKETVKESIKERALERSFDWINDDDALALLVSEDRRDVRFGRADQAVMKALRRHVEEHIKAATGEAWDDLTWWLYESDFDRLRLALLWCEVHRERIMKDPDAIRDPVGFIRAGAEGRKTPGLHPLQINSVDATIDLILEIMSESEYTQS
jgi:phage replication O-like protein O